MGCLVVLVLNVQHLNVTWSTDGGPASLAYHRRLRLRGAWHGSIKMIDHPWLWHGVVTRMVVLEDRPRIIVASLDTITTEECEGLILG